MNTGLHVRDNSTASPPLRTGFAGVLQRRCACGGSAGLTAECDDCNQQKLSLQRSSQNSNTRSIAGVPPIVHDVLNSPGQPLDQATRHFMEPRFGNDFSQTGGQPPLQANSNELRVGPAGDHYEREADSVAERVVRGDESVSTTNRAFDFSAVRIHADQRAAESAQAVNALAYTVGRDVVFGAGQFRPETTEGRRLIAHELAHVVQQGSSSPAGLMQRAPARVTLSTEGTCIDAREIAEAIPGARAMADAAFNWFLSFGTFDRARVARQLRVNFRSAGDDVRDIVRNRILTIRERLDAAQAGNITFVCAPSTDPECGGREGYVMSNERDRIHICEPFFNLTLEGRRWMLVHECAHLAGAMASPEFYHTTFGPIGETECAESPHSTTAQDALGHADNYARFIWCLVRRPGIEVTPPAP